MEWKHAEPSAAAANRDVNELSMENDMSQAEFETGERWAWARVRFLLNQIVLSIRLWALFRDDDDGVVRKESYGAELFGWDSAIRFRAIKSHFR